MKRLKHFENAQPYQTIAFNSSSFRDCHTLQGNLWLSYELLIIKLKTAHNEYRYQAFNLKTKVLTSEQFNLFIYNLYLMFWT